MFAWNEAEEFDSITSPDTNVGQKQLDGAQNEGGFELSPECSSCSTGRGGALFVEVSGMRRGVNNTIRLIDLRIESNKASVGGQSANLT